MLKLTWGLLKKLDLSTDDLEPMFVEQAERLLQSTGPRVAVTPSDAWAELKRRLNHPSRTGA